MTRLIALTALCAAFGLNTTNALMAQSGGAALEALDAQLPGELANDPSRIDWESYGADLVASAVVDPNIPGGGAARRFEVRRADEFIYAAGTNLPTTKSIRRGEDVTIGFYARTIEAQTDNGKGILRVRFQKNEPPYPGFGEETLEIGREWEWYEVNATAEMGLRPKDGIVAIQFGRTRQILEIGQAIIVTGATSILSGAKPPPPGPLNLPSPLELPEALRGVGKLLNNPGNRSWNFETPGGSYEVREDETIWLGRATRLTSLNGPEGAPKIVAKLPIEGPIEEGDVLVIAVAAKTVKSAFDDGKARLEIYVETGGGEAVRFAQSRIAVTDNWQLVRLKTRAPVAIPIGRAQLILQLRNPDQTLDIGPVYFLKSEE